MPLLITMFETPLWHHCSSLTHNATHPQHNRFPVHSTWLRYVGGAWCKYPSLCRRREGIFHELHGFLHSHKFCEDLVELLLCIWPLLDTVKCQVSMHRSCLEALKLLWNTEKAAMFLVPGTGATQSLVVHPLLQQACAFPKECAVSYSKAVLHNNVYFSSITWLTNLFHCCYNFKVQMKWKLF